MPVINLTEVKGVHDEDGVHNGDMVPFGREREIDVKINRIMKGRLQDCWELFRSR